MRKLTYIAFAFALLGASGKVLAEPQASNVMPMTAASTKVHIAPGISGDISVARPNTHLSNRSVTEASPIDWPIVSGDDAVKAIAAQKAAAVTPPEPTLLVSVNLNTQRMTVSENGVSKYTWLISSGRAGYDTPTGVFKPTWKTAMWYSRQYDMSPMPHSVFFSGGAAIHATYATHQLGSAASHGCVRLSPGNAKSFYGLVVKHGMDRTRISVFGKPKSSKWNVASAPRAMPRRYVMAPYGYAAPGLFSQQYFKPNAPVRTYYKTSQPRRTTVKRIYRNPSYSYGYSY